MWECISIDLKTQFKFYDSFDTNVKSSENLISIYTSYTFITYYYCLSEILIFYYRDVQY